MQRFYSHLVRGVCRLGHAVTTLDGVVELLIHGQLWVRGATCWGAETGIHRLKGVEKCPATGQEEVYLSWEGGDGAVPLALGNVDSFLALDRDSNTLQNNQRTPEPSRLF
jgi:hypothetical protein